MRARVTTLLLVLATAAFASPNERRVATLDTHALTGPFASLEQHLGCKLLECFERWGGTVYSKNAGAQYVSIERPGGWYLDSKPIDQYLCPMEIDVPASGRQTHFFVVQFFRCDVDPPDGTFLGTLVGVILCDLTSTTPSCSDFTRLGGWDAHYADAGNAKIAPVKRNGSDLIVAGQRYRLRQQPK